MDFEEFVRQHEKILQRIKKLRLFDDAFMTKCFEGSPECTELLLHVILEKPDLRVEEIQVQYTIKNLQGRSVRLDIFAVDCAGKRYNIEVQKGDEGAGAKRARYNSSLIDANILLEGDDTGNLPETYVIFITEHDVMGLGLPVCHIERTIRETGRLFEDDSHILYVNGAYRDDSPLGRLMHDFSCSDPDKMYYSPLADRVRYFKKDMGGVQKMSDIFEEYAREVADEVAKKVADEVAKKVAKEAAKEADGKRMLLNLETLMETMHLTAEQAMDALRVPAEDRESYKGRLVAS